MDHISKEERLLLALDAYQRGLFPSQNTAAKAFDVPPSTFKTRVKGTTPRHNTVANSRKLTNTEEDTLSKWILDMGRRGLPLRILTVRYLAGLLLSARLSLDVIIGQKWVNRFVKRHNELCSKYTRKYDCQRARGGFNGFKIQSRSM